jgi:hypothetical protein
MGHPKDSTSRPFLIEAAHHKFNTLDDNYRREVPLTDSWDYRCFVLLLIPVILFLVSLGVRPTIFPDSGFGFLVFRSMLDGSGFNMVSEPDAANIANDVATFQIWWSPGQYLVPGVFVRLGTDYGLALSLTTFLSTVIGVIGWGQVARCFSVTRFVLLVFLSSLVTFRFVTLSFQMYHGGEVLLFAVAPWCLYWLRYAVLKPPIACFVISLSLAALLFVAKLIGLVLFAANVLAISLFEIARQRRLSRSTLAMLAAAAVAALCFVVFWLARGTGGIITVTALTGNQAFPPVTWSAILFPLSGAAFSAISALDLARRLSPADFLATIYLLGPLALTSFIWIWYRLRRTRYRTMATVLLAVITFYTIAYVLMYISGILINFEERYLRYAGILSLLLLLVVLDQERTVLARGVALTGVVAFAVYGLISFAAGARGLMRGHYYDPISGTSQRIVPPVVLEYLRSEMTEHNWQRAIAVLPTPESAIAIPRFRIIIPTSRHNWVGRVDRLFVVAPEWMLEKGKAEVLLKSFTDYQADNWSELHFDDGTVVYSQ